MVVDEQGIAQQGEKLPVEVDWSYVQSLEMEEFKLQKEMAERQ